MMILRIVLRVIQAWYIYHKSPRSVPYAKLLLPSPFTPLIVMSDMMTNPVPPPLVTSVPSPFEESITMLSKTVFLSDSSTLLIWCNPNHVIYVYKAEDLLVMIDEEALVNFAWNKSSLFQVFFEMGEPTQGGLS